MTVTRSGKMIERCRQNFGSAPRDLESEEKRAFRLRPPFLMRFLFLARGDELRTVLRDQNTLRDHGRVVWGFLVRANQTLFRRKNRLVLPANVIYSPDSYFDDRAAVLQDAAGGIFPLKETSPGDDELGRFARAVTNELARNMRLPLPPTLCENREAYFTTCLIQPSHLPGGRLAKGVFPLVICPEKTDAVMILPSRYWPEELRAAWAPEGDGGGDAERGPPPVLEDGEVIGRSVFKSVLLIALMAIFLAVSVLILWGFATAPKAAPNAPQAKDGGAPCGFLVLAVAALFFCPILTYTSIADLLARKRLVLGRDRLQYVRRTGGEDVVITQIPYWNVDDIKYRHESGVQEVRIRLFDLDDPDTYTSGDGFEDMERTFDCHFAIGGGYTVGVPAIRDRLKSRVQKYRKRRDAGPARD